MSSEITRKSQNESMDIAKLIMAMSVVVMHSSLFTGTLFACLIWPWARVSVPLFFMMSSFFFFKKPPDRTAICHFILRLGEMYCFWFVISLPITLFYRVDWWWKDDGFVMCIIRFVRSLLFSSTFGAS